MDYICTDFGTGSTGTTPFATVNIWTANDVKCKGRNWLLPDLERRQADSGRSADAHETHLNGVVGRQEDGELVHLL